MTSVFPGSIDIFSPDPPLDNWDDVMANDVGALQDSMTAVETYLLNITNAIPGGRLTLESGVPVSSADQTAKTTLYYTPYMGNNISLNNGTKWGTRVFTELSLSLSGFTAGKNYDVFGYLNGSVAALEAVAWLNNSTRLTDLEMQDGRLVKSGDKTRLYLGVIYIVATGQCEDSGSRRFVENAYNQVARDLKVTRSTGHTNTNTAIAYWNADTTAKVEFVTGKVENRIFASILNDMICAATSSTTQGCVGLGINTSASMTAISYWASAFQGRSSNNTTFTPSLGYNSVALLERGLTGCTFNVAQLSMLVKG